MKLITVLQCYIVAHYAVICYTMQLLSHLCHNNSNQQWGHTSTTCTSASMAQAAAVAEGSTDYSLNRLHNVIFGWLRQLPESEGVSGQVAPKPTHLYFPSVSMHLSWTSCKKWLRIRFHVILWPYSWQLLSEWPLKGQFISSARCLWGSLSTLFVHISSVLTIASSCDCSR